MRKEYEGQVTFSKLPTNGFVITAMGRVNIEVLQELLVRGNEFEEVAHVLIMETLTVVELEGILSSGGGFGSARNSEEAIIADVRAYMGIVLHR